MDSTATRLPPQCLDSERGVLGSVLLFSECFEDISGIITADDLYLDAHRQVFKSFERLNAERNPIDAVTVSEDLERHGEHEGVGGDAYLIKLLNAVPHSAHVKYYASIVREKSRLRSLIYTCGDVIRQAYETTEDADALLTVADAKIVDLLASNTATEPVSCVEGIAKFTSDLESTQARGTRLATGLVDVDRLLSGGIPTGALVILGAATSVGKSAIAGNIAAHIGRTDHVLIFSLEMSTTEYFARIATAVSRLPINRMEAAIESGETSGLTEALHDVAGLRLSVDDRSRGLADILAKIRRSVRNHGTKVVFCDYLQLVAPSDRRAARHEQIGQISGAFKALAMELDIAIVALSQLSRAANEDGARPQLHHLRESGSIEMDADIVLLLSRKRDATDAVLEIAKHRGGPTGIVALTWRPDICRYDSTVSDWCDASNFDPLGDS